MVTVPANHGTTASSDEESRISTATWVGAALVVALALAVRLTYLWTVPWQGHAFVIIDPDGYTADGLLLARRHFSALGLFRSVAVFQFVKPPLYTVALGLATGLPGRYPLNAAVLQVLAAGAMVFAVFWIGYRLHSARAGLIGAFLSAVYLPSVTSANVFVQEALYIPLLTIAFALLVDAAARRAQPPAWAAAGAVFGLAALTRSLPLYYLAPALAGYVWLGADRPRALRQAAACLIGFTLLVTPYSIAVSRHVGHVVLIENMGAIQFPMRYPETRGNPHSAPPPTLLETAGMFGQAFAAHPVSFVEERLDDATHLFQLRGGRSLQLVEGLRTATEARWYKVLAHAFDDGAFGIPCVLAPFGWALARRRRESALIALWVLFNVALLAAFTFSGARYRAPCVPSLMVLGSVVLAGGWRRPTKGGLAVASVSAALLAYAVIGSLPSSLAGRAEYGLRQPHDGADTRRVEGIGEAALNILPSGGAVTFTVSLGPTLAPADDPAHVDARLGGQPVNSWVLPAGANRRVRYVWRRPGMAYLELRAAGATGRPVPFVVDVPTDSPVRAR